MRALTWLFRTTVPVLVGGAALFTAFSVPPVPTSAATSPVRTGAARPQTWSSCNSDAVSRAPHVVWNRIEMTAGKNGIPVSYWRNATYRHDIAKIICYESTYYWHAENGPQYGWFQMNQPLIGSEGVSWNEYWNGTSAHEAGWYQCLAGERYILHRYGNPLAAWEHERYYGWY